MTHSATPHRRILISLGNIGALHDGLGEFSLQVGQRVAAQAAAWRDAHGIGFDFHLREKFLGLFGAEVGYLPINRWQRWRHVQAQPVALWHSLHQLNKTLPPQGAGPRVVTVHDLNYRHGPNAFAKWRHQRRTLALLARADHVVAISQHTADDVRQHLNWSGPLQVIYNGARRFTASVQQPLPGWTATPERPFLFHLSRLSPSKNPQALIELARAWPAMLLVLCGPPGDDSQALRAAVDLPNVQVHLGISEAQKAWAYAHCSGFLFPSLAEGFGLPPIEAMHFGKPVFLARRTCLPEIGGDAAFYFDSFDGAAMKAVVQHGLLHPVSPAQVQAHAAQFDWDLCAASYLALYRRLLKLSPAA
jgi:glycosyltransferase involved in cell wall biosynthesis